MTYRKKFISFLVRHEAIVFLSVILILLRIPNLFEPYWYGDEAIYLTVGNGLRHGLVLYKQIIDHKTPLIYFVAAIAGSQFWFKFIFLWWNLASLLLFYCFSLLFFAKKKLAILASTVFMLLTTLPLFEGNIVNGELLVIGCILVSALLLAHTNMFADIFEKKLQKKSTKESVLFFASGVFFSLAVLIKVPAVLDIAAFLSIFVFLFLRKPSRKYFLLIFPSLIKILAGFAIPILLSIIYFWTKHSLFEYLEFALLYNFRYSQEFSLPFQQPLFLFLFSMKGKILAISLMFIVLALGKKYISLRLQFLIWWTTLAVFSVFLSSRVYQHYVLQAIPALSLLFAYIFYRKQEKKKQKTFIPQIGTGLVLIVFIYILHFFGFTYFQPNAYYLRFLKFVSQNISLEEYIHQFNPFVQDTYAVSDYLIATTDKESRVFIWGTNPMLYALSRRVPAGRFTVSFHIKDFDAYEETMRDIEQYQPEVIVVMKDETGAFEDFYAYLHSQYVFVKDYPTLTVYRLLQKKKYP